MDPSAYRNAYEKFTAFFPKNRATLVFAFATEAPSKGKHVSFSANLYGAVEDERTHMSIGIATVSLEVTLIRLAHVSYHGTCTVRYCHYQSRMQRSFTRIAALRQSLHAGCFRLTH